MIRTALLRRIGGALVLLAVACRPPADEAGPALTANVAASIDTVSEAAFVETVDGVGTVVARVGHVAVLSAPSPTRVARIHVAVGDRVGMNAALIDFEQPGFDAAVASADAALQAAEQSAARATRLVEAGVAPRKDAEMAAAALEAARLDAMTAHRARELAHVRAPFAGVITRLSASLGASVDAGQPLVEITDPSVLDVLLSVAPADARRLQPGQFAELFENAGGDSTRIAQARVADVSVVVDSLTRGVPVRLALASSARVLRVGESVYASIIVKQHARAIVIADAALVPTGEGYQVFVVDSANIAHARAVTLGGRASHRLWITKGLQVGERVVTTGAYGIDDGAQVGGGRP